MKTTNSVEVFHAIFYDDLVALEKAINRHGIETLCGNEETPLIYAVMMEKPRLVQWLIEHGANMYAKNIFGDTAFHLAAKKGYSEIVKSFCDHSIDLDIVGDEENTALNYAVTFGHDEVAAYLIEQGASLKIPDNIFNKTPLDRIREKKKDSLLALIEKDKNPCNKQARIG
jgi:ankyrin repeat protein